ncbi:hypothetical protein MtrunA17_Chr2g0299341 [Medicago truncatula]|uniref:DUF4408 domain-containing protein n=1 Tax=Medicago truncatula TaxID=3880 RepID=A0A396J5T9_MEDTR|nr:hypothetical protein MtrunA17_Chr2g0299341 [Medicago truncatula]
MGEEDSVSIYDIIVSWLSPSFIFLIVNLVIGTIAITSHFATQKKRQPNSPLELVRSSSSIFGRVTSFGLSCCKFEPASAASTTTTTPEETQSIDLGLSKTEMKGGLGNSTPLIRAPSLLERLMSGNFRRLDSVKVVEEEKKAESEVELKPEREIVRGRVEEEEVDAKADDFIKRFKQQLRLERLDSILRYRDILHRN